MIDKRIHRINELYKKSQKEGLTEEEKAEQLSLRKSVAANIRGNVDILMNSIDIENENGIIENLVQKYGNSSKRNK
ncbi:DUF896 domain-containing protein [Clostridium perfringens]|uniref:DUF896 domain-containing protein n=1 Tax=Clostridium perfringens TaxID=1502 RepID=UPI0018E497E7|nr:DUF896 domain-containing protein [Clostridium perfringens]MBI6109007.1 DUF896 domain-containing protein [Clostridium perfringens]